MPRPEEDTSVTGIDHDRLSALQNKKVQLGEEIARSLLNTEVNELSAVSTSFGYYLTIGTVFGNLRMFPPVSAIARMKNDTVFASTLEELDKRISLPASQTLWQWYANPINDHVGNRCRRTLPDGGGPAPRVVIKRIRFNATGLSGQLGTVGCPVSSVWAPNLNGEIEIEVEWTSVPQLLRGKHLPEHLDILFQSDFGQMMWNVEKCIQRVAMN